MVKIFLLGTNKTRQKSWMWTYLVGQKVTVPWNWPGSIGLTRNSNCFIFNYTVLKLTLLTLLHTPYNNLTLLTLLCTFLFFNERLYLIVSCYTLMFFNL